MHFTGEQPENSSDGLGHPVIAGDDNVDELEGSISIAESNGGDIDVGGLNDCLDVALGVSDDQQPWLLELLGHLVGERSGDPSGGSGSSAPGILSELIDCALPMLLGTHNDHFTQIGNRCDDPSG